MSKRFTDTEKWQRPWFRQLPGNYRQLWLYILDSCDAAGVWYVDFDLAKFLISQDLDPSIAIALFEKQIQVLDNSKKWHITGYVQFQWGTLTPTNSMHRSVISKLRSHNLLGPESHLESPVVGAMVKEEDKDKVKVKESTLESIKLCNLLISRMLLNNPKVRLPHNKQDWESIIDLMLRKDKRTVQEIECVIDFCQSDVFWRTNILSAGKLRDKFDQLFLRMQSTPKSSAVSANRDFEVAAKKFADDQKVIAEQELTDKSARSRGVS